MVNLTSFLIQSLSEEFAEEFCDALAQAAERHLQETETAKQNGDPNWWKVMSSSFYDKSRFHCFTTRFMRH